jgi:hypothetical protein
MSISQNNTAVSSGHLVSSTGSARVYPTDDAVPLAVLQARFRADAPYSRIGATNLVAVNPFKTLANVNDASAKECEERAYRDTSLPMVDASTTAAPLVPDGGADISTYAQEKRVPERNYTVSYHLLFTAFIDVGDIEELRAQANLPIYDFSWVNSSAFRLIRRRSLS